MSEYGPDIAQEALAKKRRESVETSASESKSKDSKSNDSTMALDSGASARAGSSSMQSGGSTTDALSSAGMASGNPYAMAAGTGLAVLSANQKRKQEAENQRAQSENSRISNQQAALSKMMEVANGLRRL